MRTKSLLERFGIAVLLLQYQLIQYYIIKNSSSDIYRIYRMISEGHVQLKTGVLPV